MGRRAWLIRGVAVAAVAVLVGAWALGLAELGGSASPPDRDRAPVSSDRSEAPDTYEIQRAAVLERAKPRRSRSSEPSPDARTEPSPDASDEPVDDDTDTPDPTPTDEPTDPDDPSAQPSSPPAPTPSDPPTQPDDECTDLLGCVLDPITGGP
jgi:hypothetical protein